MFLFFSSHLTVRTRALARDTGNTDEACD